VSDKRCGTCKWWVELRGYVSIPPGKRLGMCEWPKDESGRTPSSRRVDGSYSRPDGGQDCPCHEPKEPTK
jgi:hypothetical protein